MDDAPPNVRLTQPEGDLTLALAEPVEVTVSASDDFGVSALGLELQMEGAHGWRSVPLGFTAELGHGFGAADPAARLQPGGELTLRAYAVDTTRGRANGPLSAPVRIRLEAGVERQERCRRRPGGGSAGTADALEELQRVARQLGASFSRRPRGR